MKKINIQRYTRLNVYHAVEGESIETKMERITTNKEPIKDGAPIIFTERKDGVKPEYDIRTDRFEIAIDAMTAVDKSNKAKREAGIKEREEKKNGKTESIQGTE